MSTYMVCVNDGDSVRRFDSDGGETLLELLRKNGYEVHAPCGGNGSCRQCKVYVSGTCRGFDGTLFEYAGESVIACRNYPAGEVNIRLDRHGGEQIRIDISDIPQGQPGHGLAVDIGTTTVAVYFYDLAIGKCIGTAGAMNAQRSYGSDVISRIQHASTPEGLKALRLAVCGQITELAAGLCDDLKKIRYISIAGNTVMEHIFAGLNPEGIGVAPFTPLSLFGEEYAASDFLDGLADDCRLYICPAVAGYVGGDITAGLVSSGACHRERTVLFIDVGTNGEMALGDSSGFLCCATAAGPAFEGAGIECGSPAREGAISRVDRDLSYTVIGDTAPSSICGSGIIDAMAALLRRGEIDETGRLESERYYFGDVYVSQSDVRKIQLAKAAVRAGVETLLEKCNKSYDDVTEVLIAGGFGAYMNIDSACEIGLLPPAFQGRTRHLGNSAGLGAAMALTPEGRALLAGICQKCTYEELSSSALFNEKYIDSMMFDETED